MYILCFQNKPLSVNFLSVAIATGQQKNLKKISYFQVNWCSTLFNHNWVSSSISKHTNFTYELVNVLKIQKVNLNRQAEKKIKISIKNKVWEKKNNENK